MIIMIEIIMTVMIIFIISSMEIIGLAMGLSKALQVTRPTNSASTRTEPPEGLSRTSVTI